MELSEREYQKQEKINGIIYNMSPAPDFRHTAKRDRAEKKDAYEKAGVEEYWIISPNGNVEIYYLQDERYVIEQSYILQNDKEDESYNADTVIRLRAFPHIKMTLADIFEGVFDI